MRLERAETLEEPTVRAVEAAPKRHSLKAMLRRQGCYLNGGAEAEGRRGDGLGRERAWCVYGERGRLMGAAAAGSGAG